MDKKNVVQIHSVISKMDAVSNVILTLDAIHTEEGWKSSLIADLFSEYDNVAVLAHADYDKTPLLARIGYLTSRFIRLDNKLSWIKEYIYARYKYVPGYAKGIIEKANVRIWHYGAFYTLFRYFHEGDILFYHGITYPYLSYFTEFGIYSKNMLQATLDMNPFVIVHTEFIKQGLVDLGFKGNRIYILPAFHKYNLPYRHLSPTEPLLIAWGRYSLNKGIPELVSKANEYKLKLRVFGDNNQLREFSDQYKISCINNTKGYATLSGKVQNFEAELRQANIYINNSSHEGFSVPIIEAEAHSLPVLARRGTAMDELVKDGYNGYLFSNTNEIPELIEKIMKNYGSFSYNAWKHSQNFTYEKFKSKYLKVLEEYDTLRNPKPKGIKE
jgi:glycosyltransferase involved in cell wall biosynthesis